MASIKEMSTGKWLFLLIAAFFLSLLMYSVASGVALLLSHPWVHALVCLLASAAMLGLYALCVPRFEGAPSRDLPRRKLLSHTSLGWGVGFAYFTVLALVMALVGVYQVQGLGKDVTGILRAFFFFIVVAVGEEVVFRGVLFRWMDEKWGFPQALIVSALLFGLIHWTNPGGTLWSSIAIAVEAGLLLGAAYKWSGNLWFPIGIHWGWNFSQGNIYGFAVSGQEAGSSLIEAQIQGADWITGGVFGAEASVLSVVLGAILSAVLIARVYAAPGATPRG